MEEGNFRVIRRRKRKQPRFSDLDVSELEDQQEDIPYRKQSRLSYVHDLGASCDENELREGHGVPLTSNDSSKTTFSCEEVPSIYEYCWQELACAYNLQNDHQSYAEKRKKLYALFHIPIQVEKFLFYGLLQCIDAFLYFCTFLPLRLLISLTYVFRLKRWGSAEICDFLKVGIIICASVVMMSIDTSIVYHEVRSQGVIKLYIFFNMLEVADKLFSSLGQDILETLFWTANETINCRSAARTSFHFCIATIYALAHSFLVLLQAATLNVAFNSHNQALLAIMMSNNFVELKGSVFKKFAKANLFQMACSDVRERFHLLALLFVVVIRNMAAVSWNKEHLAKMLPDVIMVAVAELMVDWLKHIFITKFNEIDANVYKDFTITISFDVVKSRQASAYSAYSDQVSRRMGFAPIPLSIMLIRVLTQTFNLTHGPTLLFAFIIWLILLIVKIGNGIFIVRLACQQVTIYTARRDDG